MYRVQWYFLPLNKIQSALTYGDLIVLSSLFLIFKLQKMESTEGGKKRRTSEQITPATTADKVHDAAVLKTTDDEEPAVDDEDVPACKEPLAKKARKPAAAAAAAAPQGIAAPIVPAPVQQKQVRSKYVFYPDIYDQFDASKIAFAKDPQASRDGSGEILFLSYLFEDGMHPLMVQTPNAMHSPTGITVWKDGKCSILLSAGHGWEDTPLMVKFKQIADAIQMRCIEITCEKGWNKGGNQNPEIVQESFTNLMFVGEDKETGTAYPPSLKASVIIEGPSKTELFEKIVEEDGSVVMNGLIPSDVNRGCGITGIIHIPWVFRKKAKKGWMFSIRSNLFQARVFSPSSTGGFGAARSGCAVYD